MSSFAISLETWFNQNVFYASFVLLNIQYSYTNISLLSLKSSSFLEVTNSINSFDLIGLKKHFRLRLQKALSTGRDIFSFGVGSTRETV